MPETRVIDLHFAAGSMGLHSLVFTQLCLKVEPSKYNKKAQLTQREARDSLGI